MRKGGGITDIKEFITSSAEETEKIGAYLAEELEAKYPGQNHFAMLTGPLGAGKTALIRGAASILSPSSRVKSPSYTIVNEYRRGATPLFHFDLYRLGENFDPESIGFYEYCDSGHCFIEWSEFFSGDVPENAVTVDISPRDNGERLITVTYPEKVEK